MKLAIPASEEAMTTGQSSAPETLTRAGAVATFTVIALLYVVGTVLVVRARVPIWPDFTVSFLFAAFPVVGLLIAVRRPRNRTAWLCLGLGGVWAVELLVLASAAHEAARPGLIARPDLVLALGLPLWVPGFLLMGTFLLLLFPDGSLPSPRWRSVAWASGVLMALLYVLFVLEPGTYDDYGFPSLANPVGVERLHDHPIVSVLVALMPVLIVVSAVGLFRRFRQATGIERLQLKWLVAAAGLVATLFLLVVAAVITVAVRGGDVDAVIESSQVVAMLFALIPASIGVAVLRYRLFEIDRVISRTVTYGLVIGVLVAVYAGGVLLLRTVSPWEGELAVAASTLAVAALFNPLRRRVQVRVDRRFNRARYDAERELAQFAGRLRDELHLDTLGFELVTTAAQTMEPATVSLWFRDAEAGP